MLFDCGVAKGKGHTCCMGCMVYAIKNDLNKAILLMSINEAFLSRQTFVPFKYR